MPRTTRWMSLAFALWLCLVLPLGAVAQSGSDEATPAPVLVPELEGLAWHRAVDTTGPQIEASREPAEVDAWARLAERADATLEELEYDVLEAFDPAALPDLGSIATVRVAGAETGALRDAVVQDIVDQVVDSGNAAPQPVEDTIVGRDITVVPLSGALGYYEEAVIYAVGDVAYVLLLPRPLMEQALEQLP